MMEEIIKQINNAKNIAIFFHINPDGDAIGSSLALKHALSKLNKNVRIFSSEKIVEFEEFLDVDQILTKDTNENFDLAFVLDCPELKRIGTTIDIFKKCKKSINIDHHLNNQNFTDYVLSNVEASSTCELVYELIVALNIEITKDIASSIYTGLATDTGSFMFNLSKNVHKIAGELINKFDAEFVNYKLFREKSHNQLMLYGESLKKLEVLLDGKLAITDIDKKDFDKTNTTIIDTPGIVFLLSGIANVNVVCVVCEEKKGIFKIAFRSNNTDVCKIAGLFGGGGHKFASGCKMYGTKNTVKNNLIKKIKEYLCTE